MWFDARKTRNELKPNRVTHRVHEMLEQFEAERGDKQEVSKNVPAKIVKVGGKVAGFCSGCEWQWGVFAKERCEEEQLDLAKAYAEQL